MANSKSKVTLTWGDVTGETGYKVQRSTNKSTYSTIATTGANVTTYADTAVSANTTYSYRVVATNGQDSAPSNVISVKTPNR